MNLFLPFLNRELTSTTYYGTCLFMILHVIFIFIYVMLEVVGVDESKMYNGLISLSTNDYLLLHSIATFFSFVSLLTLLILFERKLIRIIGCVTLVSSIVGYFVLSVISFKYHSSIEFQWNDRKDVYNRIQYEKENECCFYYFHKSMSWNEYPSYVFADCPYVKNGMIEIENSTCETNGDTSYCLISNEISASEWLCGKTISGNPYLLQLLGIVELLNSLLFLIIGMISLCGECTQCDCCKISELDEYGNYVEVDINQVIDRVVYNNNTHSSSSTSESSSQTSTSSSQSRSTSNTSSSHSESSESSETSELNENDENIEINENIQNINQILNDK